MENNNLPLLLLDNNAMSTVVNEGDFISRLLSFDEAKVIVDTHKDAGLIRCFTGSDLKEVFFQYLGIEGSHIPYRQVTDMLPGQDAIVFKLYVTPSETQPIIESRYHSEAKKVHNIYVHCQYIHRKSGTNY